jgi:hypothetical protein
VADDAQAARDAIRPMVGTSLITSRPILGELGVEMPAQFAAAMERAQWRLDAEVVGEAAGTLPQEILDTFGLAGTAEDCRERLGALLGAFPQISEVVIVPFAARGQATSDVVARFIDEVAPRPVGSGT